MKIFRLPIVFILVTQSVLLVIELVTHYDSLQRQLALVVTNVVATLAVVLFDRRLRRGQSALSSATILFVAAAIWLDAAGNFQHLYGQFWWWDRLTHIVGGMAISAGFIDFYQAQRRAGQLVISWGQATWFGFLVGQFLGAVYEISEYLGDTWFQTARVRGPFDTPHDLLNNALGGLFIIVILRLSRSTKK
jgi:hypothetical protein